MARPTAGTGRRRLLVRPLLRRRLRRAGAQAPRAINASSTMVQSWRTGSDDLGTSAAERVCQLPRRGHRVSHGPLYSNGSLVPTRAPVCQSTLSAFSLPSACGQTEQAEPLMHHDCCVLHLLLERDQTRTLHMHKTL
jgi:hypothetical protein